MHLVEILRENIDVLGLSIYNEGVECLNYLHLDTSYFQSTLKYIQGF